MRHLFWIALVATAVGCKAVPAMHYYMLEPRAETTPAPGGGLTVGVLPFAVDSPYDQDRIVYRVGDSSAEVGFYAYHRWAAPLSRMMPTLVAEGLAGPLDDAIADVILGGYLRELARRIVFGVELPKGLAPEN